MRAGQLRHTVTIKRPVATTNSYGEQTVTWVPVATDLRVGINPATDKEDVEHYGFSFIVNDFDFGAPGAEKRALLDQRRNEAA